MINADNATLTTDAGELDSRPAQAPPAPPAPIASPLTSLRVRLTTVTSVVILTRQQKTTFTGTIEQLEARCHQTFMHNVLFGWWGVPFGLIWTPIALIRNHRALREIRGLGAAA